jgi:hypothetical protein
MKPKARGYAETATTLYGVCIAVGRVIGILAVLFELKP